MHAIMDYTTADHEEEDVQTEYLKVQALMLLSGSQVAFISERLPVQLGDAIKKHKYRWRMHMSLLPPKGLQSAYRTRLSHGCPVSC